MTRKETAIIMDILTTAYPRFYKGPDAPDVRKTMNLWAEMFADDPVEIVAAATKALIECEESGYPPDIGKVKGYVRRLTQPQYMTADEAWAYVRKACQNGLYGSQDEFNKLPPDVQRIVHTPETLRAWALEPMDTLETVTGSTFKRSFREHMERKQQYDALPADIREKLNLSGALKTAELPAET